MVKLFEFSCLCLLIRCPGRPKRVDHKNRIFNTTFTPPLPPLSPPTDLSGTPVGAAAELSVLNFNEPAGANFPTVGAGQVVRYELFLNNQDPNLLPNPPNSIYALWGRQKSSTGAGNPVSDTSAPSSAFRNVSANSSPSGKYYFMARTLLFA